jgi:hypothetical protein
VRICKILTETGNEISMAGIGSSSLLYYFMILNINPEQRNWCLCEIAEKGKIGLYRRGLFWCSSRSSR